jgi:peptidoglycan/LPS O-acetylase OafA/YrhL
MLAWRPLAYVGRISYGLYLWHFLFIWWGWPAPLVIVVSIAIAIASYERFERPFLRFKDRFARASVSEDQPPDLAPSWPSPGSGR